MPFVSLSAGIDLPGTLQLVDAGKGRLGRLETNKCPLVGKEGQVGDVSRSELPGSGAPGRSRKPRASEVPRCEAAKPALEIPAKDGRVLGERRSESARSARAEALELGSFGFSGVGPLPLGVPAIGALLPTAFLGEASITKIDD